MNKQSRLNRDSNIEILRIISMFLIIMGHFSQLGYFDNKSVSVNDINWESVFFIQIRQFARPACSIFGLISGYYQIRGGLSKEIVIHNNKNRIIWYYIYNLHIML